MHPRGVVFAYVFVAVQKIIEVLVESLASSRSIEVYAIEYALVNAISSSDASMRPHIIDPSVCSSSSTTS
jgi:hypothetical protein